MFLLPSCGGTNDVRIPRTDEEISFKDCFVVPPRNDGSVLVVSFSRIVILNVPVGGRCSEESHSYK